MGSILSPNESCEAVPTKVLRNKSILEKAKMIYIDQGYWKNKDKVENVSYYELEGDGRKWYEIHCINNGENMHFISLGKKEFENYKYKIKPISETKKLDNLDDEMW